MKNISLIGSAMRSTQAPWSYRHGISFSHIASSTCSSIMSKSGTCYNKFWNLVFCYFGANNTSQERSLATYYKQIKLTYHLCWLCLLTLCLVAWDSCFYRIHHSVSFLEILYCSSSCSSVLLIPPALFFYAFFSEKKNSNYTSEHFFISVSQETQPKATEGLRICNTKK